MFNIDVVSENGQEARVCAVDPLTDQPQPSISVLTSVVSARQANPATMEESSHAARYQSTPDYVFALPARFAMASLSFNPLQG